MRKFLLYHDSLKTKVFMKVENFLRFLELDNIESTAKGFKWNYKFEYFWIPKNIYGGFKGSSWQKWGHRRDIISAI